MLVDKYVVAGLIMIIMLGVYVPYATSTQVYAGTSDDMKRMVAERVINMVRERINGLLALAEKHGITIPENLTDNIDQSMELLDQAEAMVESDPREAIKLSIRASMVCAPVARFILKNLPEGAISIIISERLEKAIEVKIGMVERLNNTIIWLEEKGIPYSGEAKTLLTESYELLLEAQRLLESGEYNTSIVARLLGQASMKIGQATRLLYRSIHRDWVRVNMISNVGIQMRNHLERLVKILNRTVSYLEEETSNTTETSIHLMEIAERVENLANIIDRHMGGVPRDSNITRAMVVIRDALYDVADLLNEAADYLRDGDTNSAIAAIQAAIDRIIEAVEEAGDYLHDVMLKMIKLKEILPVLMGRLHRGLRKYVAAHLGGLIFKVGLIDASLHVAYRKYNEGRLSKSAFLALLNRTESILTTILDKLHDMRRPPQVVVDKINSVLEWIRTVRSEIQST